MEVVAAPPPSTGSSPFRDHDVREWSRIDSITGALERARLETDSWAATTRDATHRYGKVVDSRARTGTDGSLQAQASRQLEVFQSRAAGASLQVVKTTTVSSSRWSGKVENPAKALGFEDLQLPLNPLDLTSEKSKASVGRSANRRPPSRHPRATSSAFNDDLHHHIRNVHFTAATNLHRVSRLCHQIHESAVRNAFGRKSPPLSSRGSADGSVSGVEITEIESSATSNSDLNSHSTLTRAKSNSSEDVQQIPEKESGLEELESWRRNSKIRRSLPFSGDKVRKSAEIPESSVSVKKLRDELEKGRRLTTALRNNSLSGDLNAIDNIIQSISSASSLERSSVEDSLDDNTPPDKDQAAAKSKQKRESFVTVESLQEIKGRLRRTSSPGNIPSKPEDSDDGIGTSEDTKVKSYVYGMEKMLPNKKSVIGTGSLESRSKFANGTATNKSEDWYNRRKSYGFEKVHSPEDASSMSLKDKTFVESSTDSGICRSSEIMVVPTATKSNTNNGQTNGLCNSEESSESDVENKFGPNADKSLNGIHYGNVKKMTSIFNQEDKNPFISGRSSDLAWRKKNELKSTTITIPIVKNNNVVDLPWNDEPEKDTSKKHSVAVDEKYNATNGLDNQFRKSNLGNDVDEDNLNGIRRAKKVEFCKTEVHFAAESGKVNIVETDEKPPPTQNFRRRRRNSGPSTDYPPDFNKNGLPMLHFGDTVYEKSMYGVADPQEQTPSAFSVVTVNSTGDSIINHLDYTEEERKDFNSIQLENDNLKGILKNKPIKPKPYHLGESVLDSDEDSSKWGVKLRHVPKEQPIWKSTVTVRNTYQQDDQIAPTSDLPEFQKLLKNLRPTSKKPDYMSDNENRYSDSFANIRVVPAAKDNRRSSWSVADRVKLDEEIQSSRGYSTKVNFGDGQATVVQNDQSTWPRVDHLSKDSRQILNRGLVVRIGKQDSASKQHTVCSKMTTTRQHNNTTTTTKITIDLSPSPPTTDKRFLYTKYNKRSQNPHHSFKSTPLVLNTIKDQKEAVSRVPQQLEALRKLYEDIPSDEGDSDADKEVQRLLSGVADRQLIAADSDDGSSVISGSWSRMRAFKNITEAGRGSFKDTKLKFDLNSRVKDNKGDIPQEGTLLQPKTTYNKYSIPSTNGGSKYSPVVLRKTIPLKPTELRSELAPHPTSSVSNRNQSPPTREFKNSPDHNLRAKCVTERAVLRQPKQSEMTYFGVGVAKTNKEEAVVRKEQKPDLLRNHTRAKTPPKGVGKPRKPTPEVEVKSNEHIYENIHASDKEVNSSTKYSRKDFDSAILDELTKAADQILQAVNGYTSEDCQNRLSGDEDDVRKPLDTISETKSWKNLGQDLESRNQQRMRPTLASAAKIKVKRTSSNSSVESLSRDRRRNSISDKPRTIPAAPTIQERPKKKTSTEHSSNTRSSTKARRLQRASSREALLQSHGSSSEDLPANIEAPVRKPRLIKKTKTSQLTLTSGIELKKPVRKSREEKSSAKNDSRILGSLPEIRHKTAFSTITSTAEKCSRDRSKTRNDENKSRSYTKKESSSKGTVSSSSTVRQASSSSKSSQRPLAREPSGVTQHRISTANIKRCHRAETATRH